MSRAYSRIARSLENFPIRETFRIAHARPFRRIFKSLRRLLLRVQICREIRQVEKMVAPVDKHAVDPSEKIRLIAAEQVGLERVDHAANAGITIIILAGAISVAQRLYLIRLEPEDEDILRTNLFPDLDVGAVHGADGERAVERELHVSGTGRFRSSGGNLLAEIGGWNDFFSQRDAIVRNERHLHPVAGARVVIDDPPDVVDQFNNLLGHPVAGSRFAGEDIRARHGGRPAVFNQ